ncbi:Dihydrolipoyllysine-residue acetyltransferase component of pyruvate dehydrogenase complex [Roseovarius gaetbuli]|uniref:Dihydrolipoamide acetyltransferase component of pyruvate dehydrogenase complex n=1 Tax=Roseovarius gaetbuli TaxID=1356575 RepID=A0A1X6Z261_9RHOB|nr:dihydrolipoamide acetyltransferase family protein [Roseovarius gaetbuli]SLN37986.1 Dihydrolipoyllysine-residue acetyltransferase component of pyruvate dehydrogenase complex [Roseovarius gaetbuli]
MSAFLMPSLGADMEAGTLVEQLMSPGDNVRRGDVIAAVETQKGVIEIEVFEDGVLEDWLVDPGTKVPVGTPLAMIRSAANSAADPDTPEPEAPQPHDPKPASVPREDPAPHDPAPKGPGPEVPAPEGPFPEIPMPEDRARSEVKPIQSRPRISPAARRLAAQTGVDLSRLAPGAARPITRSDIAAMAKPKPEAQSDMRAAIAAAMSRSKREIPHYYLSHTVDLTKAEAFITAENATRAPDERLLLGVLYLKALARAVKKVPEMNGTFEEGHFHQSEAVHAGLAIALRSGGLVAPALFDTDRQNLDDLMTSMRDLIARVRAGRYRARELSDATITLTSLGDRGVDQLYGVIYPPQVAIVGVGTPALRPWVEGKKVVPRLTATLTLAADHRVSDGRRGALFLSAIAKHLQDPETL